MFRKYIYFRHVYVNLEVICQNMISIDKFPSFDRETKMVTFIL